MEPPETIYLDDPVVSCDGGPMGHPLVYLNLEEKHQIDCPYCGRRFILNEHAEAEQGEEREAHARIEGRAAERPEEPSGQEKPQAERGPVRDLGVEALRADRMGTRQPGPENSS